jgi:hypothetical protein
MAQAIEKALNASTVVELRLRTGESYRMGAISPGLTQGGRARSRSAA